MAAIEPSSSRVVDPDLKRRAEALHLYLDNFSTRKGLPNAWVEAYLTLLSIGPRAKKQEIAKKIGMGAAYTGVLISKLQEVGIMFGPNEASGGCVILDPQILLRVASPELYARDKTLEGLAGDLHREWEDPYKFGPNGLSGLGLAPQTFDIRGWDYDLGMAQVASTIRALSNELAGQELVFLTPLGRLFSKDTPVGDVTMPLLERIPTKGKDGTTRITMFVGSDDELKLNGTTYASVKEYIDKLNEKGFIAKVRRLPALPKSDDPSDPQRAFPFSHLLRTIVLGEVYGIYYQRTTELEHKFIGRIFYRDTKRIAELKDNLNFLESVIESLRKATK